MAWRVKEAKRQKRGSQVVGARLVFDNGLSEEDPAYKQSDSMIYGRNKDEDMADFKRRVLIERDAWLVHFDTQELTEAAL